MKRLNRNQLSEWLTKNKMVLDQPRVFKQCDSGYGIDVSLPKESRKLAALARLCVNYASSDQYALIISQTDIWPTEEFDCLFDLIMKSLDDSQSLKEAPAMLFTTSECSLATDLWRFAIISGWDASLVSASSDYTFTVSHDEWFGIYATSETLINQMISSESIISDLVIQKTLWKGSI